jgi:hypothetical protein
MRIPKLPRSSAVRLLIMIGVACYSVSRTSADTSLHAVAPCASFPRPCDQIWLVSTRAFPCGDPRAHVQAMSYEQYVGARWQASNLAALQASSDPGVATIIHVHGNRYDLHLARQEGFQTYRKLVSCLSCDQPVRFIIFVWPSDRIGKQLEDVRLKLARTIPNAYYLAWLLDQLGTASPTSLLGHSYGARIITGALHLLGGGTLNGWQLTERAHAQRAQYRAVLVAAAVDSHWLMPGHRHGNAMSQISHLTLIYNSCDRVLERYRFVYWRRSGAQALGYIGFVGRSRLGADAAKITQIDACCYVGKYHSWEHYLPMSSLMARIRTQLLAAPPAAVATVAR